jgi:hypothetical protein
MVDQNAPHHFRTESEKARATFPLSVLQLRQSQVDLIQQSAGLQRVIFALIRKMTPGESC